MQKQIVKFEVKKGERVYQLLMDSDSPLGEVHDVLFEMRSYVINTAQQAIKQDERNSPPSTIDEVTPDAGQ